jgi:hypothetical protein
MTKKPAAPNPPLPFSCRLRNLRIAQAKPKHKLSQKRTQAASFLFGSLSFAEKEKEHPLALITDLLTLMKY